MTEGDVVARTHSLPATVKSLEKDLAQLGVTPGMALLVHSSLSSIGWVCGGAPAVIEALLRVVGESGTLVMPTHTAQLTDPAGWISPPVPEAWWGVIRNEQPAYDPRTTPTRSMGIISETFRSWPNAYRSQHPHFSFAAVGPRADAITSNHPLTPGLGEDSPLGRLCGMDGMVLLLGVGFEKSTSLHLAEYRANYPGKAAKLQGAPIMLDGKTGWKVFADLDFKSDDFAKIGDDFIKTGQVTIGKVGLARAYLFSHAELVAFAVPWIEQHRTK